MAKGQKANAPQNPHRIYVTDMAANNAMAESGLSDREAQLVQTEQRRGALSSQERSELHEIKRQLKNKQHVFDPLFVAVSALTSAAGSNQSEQTGDTIPTHIGDEPVKFHRQKGSTAFWLGEDAYDPSASNADLLHRFLCLYGMLSVDTQQAPGIVLNSDDDVVGSSTKDPTYTEFSKAFYKALGDFNAGALLAARILPVLVDASAIEGHYEIKASEYARVFRYLVDHKVGADEPQLARRVNEALDSVQNVGSGLVPSAIGINLPDLEEQTDNSIVADNIKAMQPAYFSAMLEELRVPQVVDKLAELFQNGVLPIGRGPAGDFLYKYWKESATRVQEPERRSFYARTLGIPGGDDGGSPNREFSDLWLRFVSAVSQFVRQQNVDDLLRAKIPATISQQTVRKAGRDLAVNLSLHGYGMAYFMATELQKMVGDYITLLSDKEIKSAYGARDMWQVVDQVATLELGGAKNSVKYRTMATSGTIVMAWLANNASRLSGSNYDVLIDIEAIRNPVPRPAGTKATVQPTDYDLVNACEQWLAVTGTEDTQVESYAQPREAPAMTSRPIQIPSIAKDMLEAAGVPAMSLGNGRRF